MTTKWEQKSKLMFLTALGDQLKNQSDVNCNFDKTDVNKLRGNTG